MKKIIFKPGVLSIFFLALMMYLSCQKQNDNDVATLQRISASGVKVPLNEIKWLNKQAAKSNNIKPGNYLSNIWITY